MVNCCHKRSKWGYKNYRPLYERSDYRAICESIMIGLTQEHGIELLKF